jgi:peptidoglycan/LPS O-acetylase OafA/YrhL
LEPELRQAPLRFYEIDLLRFVAAFSVMLYHYSCVIIERYVPGGYPVLAPFARYGWIGVELFFLISGYAILLSAHNKTLQQFFLSRITRLYPAFWAACLVTALYLHVLPGLPSYSWKVYLYNLTMMHEFLGQPAINSVYWTLEVELGFYFIISLLLSYGLWRQLPLVLLGWLLYTAWARPTGDASAFRLLLIPRYSAFFISGMLFYLLQNRLFSSWKLWLLLAASFGLALRSANTLLVLQSVAGADSEWNSWVVSGLTASFYGVFLLIIFRKLNLAAFPGLAKLGALTYPLYLIHSVGTLLLIYFGRTANKWLLLGAAIGVSVLAALLIHWLVEKPMRRPLGRWTSRALHYLSQA